MNFILITCLPTHLFSHDFLRRLYYSPDRNRDFFILDWQAAIDNSSGLFPPQEYKHMEALKRNYPELFHNIVKSGDFLKEHARFLVLEHLNKRKRFTLQPKWENIYCPRWLEMKIFSNRNYKWKVIGQVERRNLLLVDNQ